MSSLSMTTYISQYSFPFLSILISSLHFLLSPSSRLSFPFLQLTGLASSTPLIDYLLPVGFPIIKICYTLASERLESRKLFSSLVNSTSVWWMSVDNGPNVRNGFIALTVFNVSSLWLHYQDTIRAYLKIKVRWVEHLQLQCGLMAQIMIVGFGC